MSETIGQRAQRQRKRVEMVNYLRAHPCIDCGETDIRCLDFDHIGTKNFNISTMVRSGFSWKGILKEIENCVVRCANCHRKKTIGEPLWFSDLTQYEDEIPKLEVKELPPHGTRNRYRLDCRCAACKEANTEYTRQYRNASVVP